MKDQTLIADMIREGVDPDIIQRVVLALVNVNSSSTVFIDESAERRRAADRERKANKKNIPQNSAENNEFDLIPSPSSLPLPPSFSLPSTPPLPLTPSIPHSSTPPLSAVSPSQKRQSKREQRDQNAIDAANVSIPTAIQHPLLETLWVEFCEYRKEMAQSKGCDWTPRAARMLLAECERNGTAKSIAALRKAMARGWRGLVWENLEQETSMVELNELTVTNYSEPEPEVDLWEKLEANRAKAAEREAAENAEPDSTGESEWT